MRYDILYFKTQKYEKKTYDMLNVKKNRYFNIYLPHKKACSI